MLEEVLQFLDSLDWAAAFMWLAGLAFIAIGLAGTIIPGIPGHPLILAGSLAVAWAGDFESVGWVALSVLAVLATVGFGADLIAQMTGARRAGASRYGVAGALAGTVAGLFFGVIGIVFMPLLGAFAGELIAARGMKKAGSIGIATWFGMLAGAVIKVAIGCTMVAVLLLALWL